MSLDDWLRNRWLTEHASSRQEVAELLALIARDLSDSRAEGISLDWSFCMAYNAAFQAATLALHVAGYRAGRESHHERTIESLQHTLGLSEDEVQVLQRFRRKRNTVSNRSGVEGIDSMAPAKTTVLSTPSLSINSINFSVGISSSRCWWQSMIMSVTSLSETGAHCPQIAL